MNAELAVAAQAWLAADPDPDTRAELAALLQAQDEPALRERFGSRLTFGTAGLRGPLRAGPNGMNRAVVRRTAAGLARYLQSTSPAGAAGLVVVGYDARHKSVEFAHDSAAVLAAAGFDVRLLSAALPTPVLAFAVRRLGAVAGVMVTASHNPPRDNGYKVYLSDGAQIVPPADAAIEAATEQVGPLSTVPLSSLYTVAGPAVLQDYLDAVAGVPRTGHRELRLVYTALHGVGTPVLLAALDRAGFAAPEVVRAQADPDPDFPTVAFPNPEEPGAMDLALALARTTSADLVVANDPDADRCAVGCRDPAAPHGWRMLRGDEVGVLLADHLIRTGAGTGTFATTIVSSSLLQALCAARGVRYAETLTGFKWIMRAAADLTYGYEEALGYGVAPALVRDKDGISAALLVADLAAGLRAEGRTLLDRLDELAVEFGVYATDQLSVRVDELAQINAAMGRLRASPPARLLGRPVTVEDLSAGAQASPRGQASRPGGASGTEPSGTEPSGTEVSGTEASSGADVIRLRADRCRVVVRPSGTEPKLKAYLEVVVPVPAAGEPATGAVSAARATAASQLDQLRGETAAAVGMPAG